MLTLAGLAKFNKPIKLASISGERRSHSKHPECSNRSFSAKAMGRTVLSSSTAGSRCTSRKRCGRKCCNTCRWFLQSTVRCSKAKRDLQANTRPINTQQVLSCSEVQARQPKDCVFSSLPKSLDGKPGSKGCLLSRSDSRKQQEISAVQCERSAISVQSPTLRSLSGTIRLYSGNQQCGSSLKEAGSDVNNVSRRLDSNSRNVSRFTQTNPVNTSSSVRSGICAQLGEESVNPKPTMCVSRSKPGHTQRDGYSVRKEQRAAISHSKVCVSGISSDCSKDASLIGPYELLRRPDAQRPSKDEANSILATGEVETSNRQVARLPNSRCPSQADPPMVVECEGGQRREDVSEGTGSHAPVRCFFNWLGSCSRRRPSGLRGLEPVRSTTSYQSAGVESSLQCSKELQGASKVLNSSLPGGQLNSGELSQERGGNEISSAKLASVGDATLVRLSSDFHSGSAHTRQDESCIRQSVKGSDSYRVVHTSPGDKSSVQKVGDSINRLVCNESEPQVEPILQPSTGSSFNGCGRTQPELAGRVRVCFSSESNSTSCIEEDSERELQDHTYSTILASQELVHTNSKSSDSSSIEGSSYAQASVPERTIPLQATAVQLPRLAAFQQSRAKEGFSAKAATYAGKCVRESSQAVYGGKWRVFAGWCSGEEIDPLNISGSQLVEFMIYLFEDRKLSVSSIKGYRSAVSHVLGRSFPKDSADMVGEVLRGMTAVTNQPAKSRIPKWDMTVVLHHLSKPTTDLR